DEADLPPNVHIIDAGGSTIVPGMVDAHSHVTLPGGSHWIERGADPPEELLEVAEHNGDLLGRAGVRWARDVGSPLAVDPRDGRRRALALRVRERWRSDSARPRVRVAGTWISHSGVLTGGLLIEADDGPSLLKAASTQLEDGGDFRADDDVAAVRQRRREGSHRASAGAGDRERPTGPPGGRADRDRDGFRRRVASREPPRVGGRVARRGRAEACGGARVRDDPGRRAAGRGGGRSNRRKRAGGLLPRARRSAP